MKRQQLLPTDSDAEEKRMKTSSSPSNTMKYKSKTESKQVILPIVVLKRVAILLAEETKPITDKMMGKNNRESFFNLIRIAGTSRALRRCVFTHNQATLKHQLRVRLNGLGGYHYPSVYIDGRFKCAGEVVEQVKVALNFFCPNELLLVFAYPQLEETKQVLDAFGDIELSSVKTKILKIRSTASISHQLLGPLPFVQQLTHVELDLIDDGPNENDISTIFLAIGRCHSLQLFEIDCRAEFATNYTNCVNRSMEHLLQLQELRNTGLFRSWKDWDDERATLFNKIPAALSSLCKRHGDILPDSVSLSEAARANIDCFCCVIDVDDLRTMGRILEGILKRAPNCRKIVVSEANFRQDVVTTKKVDRMCKKLIRWLAKTTDQRKKIEVVVPDLLEEIYATDDLEYTLGERSVALNHKPENGIECVFDILPDFE